jgi:c-di-GMP-related signal transduction protein
VPQFRIDKNDNFEQALAKQSGTSYFQKFNFHLKQTFEVLKCLRQNPFDFATYVTKKWIVHGKAHSKFNFPHL